MTKSIHLSLDAMGGDYAPKIVVEGAAQSKIRYPNLKFSHADQSNVHSLEVLDLTFPKQLRASYLDTYS